MRRSAAPGRGEEQSEVGGPGEEQSVGQHFCSQKILEREEKKTTVSTESYKPTTNNPCFLSNQTVWEKQMDMSKFTCDHT